MIVHVPDSFNNQQKSVDFSLFAVGCGFLRFKGDLPGPSPGQADDFDQGAGLCKAYQCLIFLIGTCDFDIA